MTRPPDSKSAHHRPGGGFRNPWLTADSNRWGGALRWILLERPFKSLPRDPDPSVFPIAEPSYGSPRAAAGSISVTWVGHATTLLQLGRMNVLTDPMWSRRASPNRFAGPERWVRPGVAFERLPPIDAVLQSHNHYDHLDSPTVRRIARAHPRATWLVPLGLEGFVRKRGAAQVHELDWWEEVKFDGLRVASMPAQHFSGRGIRDRNATLWCGWALAAGERRVFFAGDSGHHPEFRLIAERLGLFDVSLLPIGAYEPAWFMRPAHMDPEEAVDAFVELGGAGEERDGRRRVMVPIHYGTFKLTDEAMDEPPRRLRVAWERAGLPPADLWILAHGETRWL